MNYTPEQKDRYRKAWARRAEERRRYCRLRRNEAHEEAKSLAARIAGYPGVFRVMLFGSVLKENRFREESDIDLAVWGLRPRDYFKALADLENHSSFPIDLIPMEDARSGIAKRIQNGEVLYERKES